MTGVGLARAKVRAAAGPVEGPWALPDGWRWERLGDLGEFLNGAAFKPKDWGTEGLPIIRIQNLNNVSRVMHRTTRQIDERLRIVAGDILVSWSATLDAFIWKSEDAWLNQHIFRVLPRTSVVDRHYLFYLLKNEIEALKKGEHLHGSTMMHINRGPFLAHPVPLPSLATQRAIVARIDALFAEVEDGEAALRQARADLGTWRKALLKAAVTGELTADWRAERIKEDGPPQETGTDLLRRILTERRTRWHADPRNKGKQYVEPAAPDADEKPNIPDDWVWTTIGQLFQVFVGATPSRADPDMWSGDIPWVSSGEVGFCRIAKTRERISAAAVRGSTDRIHPPGTVMLGMIGEGKTRGQAAILNIAAAHNQNCASIRVSATPVPPDFVYMFFRERYEKTRSGSSGGNQPALNKARIESMEIALPPLSECHEIVRVLGIREEDADASAGLIASANIDAATLRQSILAAAFRGALAA